jgi:hypothetical protein
MVTLEFTKTPLIPSPVALLKGNVVRDTAYMTMKHLGDLSMMTGGLTFTSPSDSDAAAYQREFYLLRFDGSTATSSLTNLPTLPDGWRYGLWAADYEFFPYHEFLYGLFNAATGHDNDSMTDAYPFPGGAKKQPMNIGTGRIVVTLEPPLYGDSLRYKGAELLTLLQFDRIVNIERDRFYQMSNVSGGWLPSGRLTFRRRI